jgi:uncharacterized membrane protein YhhN
MINIGIPVLGVVLLAGLLYFNKKESVFGKLFTKTPLSLLFIVVALMQTPHNPLYYQRMLYGLVLCLAGDVLLVFREKTWFLLGLISFLVGHVFFGVSFFTVSRISPEAWKAAGIVLAVSLAVFIWLKPHLGSMKLPVAAYVIVITVMVIGAASVFFDTSLSRDGRHMVLAGAILFYFSDIFVALDRFVKKAFVNRLFGLPLYYAGMFSLAFSVGQI